MKALVLLELEVPGDTAVDYQYPATGNPPQSSGTSLSAHADVTVTEASLRALGVGRALAGTGSLAAVVFGDADAGGGLPGVLAEHGVGDVYLVGSAVVAGYAPQAWARVIAGLIEETGATAVLAAATDRGNEVMAHLGAITGLPMAANCLSVSAPAPADGGYVITRQRWAGLLEEEAVLDAPVALLTVAAEAIPPTEADAPSGSGAPPEAAEVHRVVPDISGMAPSPGAVCAPAIPDGDLVVRAVESPVRDGGGGASLATARVVVGGGRGVGGADGFAPLEELASLLGGVVGVSRVVTSEGWRPHRQQVGQTGTKITPELYLACGISGAIQHIAGCSGAKHIIAINTDPGAPILAHADYAVIGDLHEIIPALVAAIRARSAAA
ncbi:MAG: electron transfer flavoprotein subunit alpha/FixB family protein [Nocardiopsaceae bacterium]|nr:electron transfer flavoprotein subunit alpha/FixB family protein [Nocardiopsaceae bacterium]